MRKILLFMTVVFSLGCTTTEKLNFNKIQPTIDLQATSEPVIKTVVETQLVYIERPFYIPAQDEDLTTRQTVKDEAVTEDDRIRQAFDASAIKPNDWNGGMVKYDFIADYRYYIYAKPLYFTDIRLQPGERFNDDLIISDTVRWVVETTTSVSGGLAQQHILIKPKETGLSCSLIIFTDRRTYYCDLQSSAKYWMMGAMWDYPDYRITPAVTSSAVSELNSLPNLPDATLSIDPDYTIRYNSTAPPQWCPDYVYNDGSRTVIVFPKTILDAVMPGLWEDENAIVNYNIEANKMLIPRVMRKFTLKLNNEKVIVEKENKNG